MQRTYGLYPKEAPSLLVIRRLLLSNLFCLVLLSISSKSAGAMFIYLRLALGEYILFVLLLSG